MPLNLKVNSEEALSTFRSALMGESFSIHVATSSLNRLGKAKGRLLGGNLSIIYSLLGTDDAYDFNGSILFIEDLEVRLKQVNELVI